MQLMAPDYYTSFRCTASDCVHSCCIGWEIDIDEDTLEYYDSLEGDIAQKLAAGICRGEGEAHFALTEGERCPFLNEKGLCEIILSLGEESLCRICSDHPRFRNYFSHRTELGLGLCCEAAARLIMEKEEKTELVCLAENGGEEEGDEWEKRILDKRAVLIAAAQEREKNIRERMELVCTLADAPEFGVEPVRWAKVLENLERLEESWGERIEMLKRSGGAGSFEKAGNAFEQLLVYFLYRHLPDAFDEADLKARAIFAVLSTELIAAMWDGESLAGLEETARQYSSEIEYSDENLEKLLSELKKG